VLARGVCPGHEARRTRGTAREARRSRSGLRHIAPSGGLGRVGWSPGGATRASPGRVPRTRGAAHARHGARGMPSAARRSRSGLRHIAPSGGLGQVGWSPGGATRPSPGRVPRARGTAREARRLQPAAHAAGYAISPPPGAWGRWGGAPEGRRVLARGVCPGHEARRTRGTAHEACRLQPAAHAAGYAISPPPGAWGGSGGAPEGRRVLARGVCPGRTARHARPGVCSPPLTQRATPYRPLLGLGAGGMEPRRGDAC